MHPTRHLQQFILTEVTPGEHVPAPLDDVCILCIVNDYGIQALHVQCRLSGGGHRQEERLLDLTLEKWSDHPNRLTAMVECGVQSLPLRSDLCSDSFDLRARR